MEWDVMGDGHTLHGLIIKMLDYPLDGCIILAIGVNHILSHLVIIIQPEDINHVELKKQLLNVKKVVFQDILLITKKIFIMQNKFIH